MESMTLAKVIVGWALLVACASAQVLPYESVERARLLEEERGLLAKDSLEIRRQLFQRLPAGEAAIVTTIRYRIDDDDDIQNCYAFIEGDQHIVVIGLGFTRALRMFIDAMLLERIKGQPGSSTRYVNYILKGWQENLKRRAQHMAPLPIESPYTYLRASRVEIDQIQEPGNRLWGSALAFALAHETGHHVLGHVSGTSRTRKQSQERETEADAWAMKTLLAAGDSPAAGLMAISYFAALFEQMGEDATHPAPEDRARRMIVATLENFDRFKARLEQSGQSSAAIEDNLRQGLAALDSASKSNEKDKVSRP